MSNRCPWCEKDPLYIKYHDEEWGVPVHDDQVLFEFLILEGMQAGLSWLTILRKRDSFRKAFANFDPNSVAQFTESDIKRLMQNPGIIRNLRKIETAIENAKRFLDVQKEYGTFDRYIWSFTNGKTIYNRWSSLVEVPCFSDISDKMSKDLKKRGFGFIGTKICYSFMQAVGIVFDHLITCDILRQPEESGI